MRSVARRSWFMISLALGVLAIACGSLLLGQYPVTAGEALAFFFSRNETVQDPALRNILLFVRLPRVLGAMLVGAGLSASGAAFQTVFRNPLASPSILGVSAGAGFGAAAAMLLQFGVLPIQISAFVGGIAAVAVSLFLTGRLGRNSTAMLVLSGLVVSSLFQALISALKYVADPLNTLPAIVFWLLGGLGRTSLTDLLVAAPFSCIGMLLLYALRWPTQILEAGDDEARSMGIAVRPLRLALITAATLTTAATLSMAGIIAWVGLLVPHLARLLFGASYPVLLPVSMLLGAGYLLLVDDLCRCAFSNEIPLGIATAVLGAPVFALVMLRARRQWS